MSFVVKHTVLGKVEYLSYDTYNWVSNVEDAFKFDSVAQVQAVFNCDSDEYVIEPADSQPTTQAKFYRLSQGEYEGYDTFNSCIVVAHSEDEARLIHPRPGTELGSGWRNYDRSWVSKEQTHLIKVEELGIAYDHLQPGTVVMSSFNAG